MINVRETNIFLKKGMRSWIWSRPKTVYLIVNENQLSQGTKIEWIREEREREREREREARQKKHNFSPVVNNVVWPLLFTWNNDFCRQTIKLDQSIFNHSLTYFTIYPVIGILQAIGLEIGRLVTRQPKCRRIISYQ